jgi:hypothetical protein
VWRIDVPQQTLAEDNYLYEQVHFCVLEFYFRNEVIKLYRGQCYEDKWIMENSEKSVPCLLCKWLIKFTVKRVGTCITFSQPRTYARPV